MTNKLESTRLNINSHTLIDETTYIKELASNNTIEPQDSKAIAYLSAIFINKIKKHRGFSIEKLLNKYPLTTQEGASIVSLAESLIRIPDNHTATALINDKLAHKNWKKYLIPYKINSIAMASIGLYISGKVAGLYSKKSTKILSKISEPILISSIKYILNLIGKEFVLGEYIDEAITRTKTYPTYLFSFDLLGEAARTETQANTYYNRYLLAIDRLSKAFPNTELSHINDRPNLSIKLTALYPRFELLKINDIKQHLIPKLVQLLDKLVTNNISVSFDAEEASRLDVYLDVITEVLKHPKFAKFNGIGLVIQAYQKRAMAVLQYVVELSNSLNKIIPVRLVKGAYWDSEIKTAQLSSLKDYPVFTQKAYTDANYIACAKYMLTHTNNIYPQFATHNAITAATIIQYGSDKTFEFQKLYGMGDVLHKELNKQYKTRIYAPIGFMDDLLSYLMRRMLENGANSSFIYNLDKYSTEDLTQTIYDRTFTLNKPLPLPYKIYTTRETSLGFELGDKMHIKSLSDNLKKTQNKLYNIGSIIDGIDVLNVRKSIDHFRPGLYSEKIGSISHLSATELVNALTICHDYFDVWSSTNVKHRSNILRKIATLYDENKYEILSLLLRESGKSIKDAIAELHEAIDFCRYYAEQADLIMQDRQMNSVTGEKNTLSMEARGVFLCISPWNFPLAIFTGQIVAALVAGNTVIAKPAEQTPIIAHFAVKLMHQAGIHKKALQLVIASGSAVGQTLVPNTLVSGVVFTGSTDTAGIINLTLAERKGALVPFIAETGGQNAMLVDSSALLEQVVDDVLTSAFHSAGQRCSSLRILYIQDEIYEQLKNLIVNAVDTLKIGDTTDLTNDIGPVIDKKSIDTLEAHINYMKEKKYKLLTSHTHKGLAKDGYYFYPHILEVTSINDIPGENFGPILHIAKYKSQDIDKVIYDINNYGFGLTFGVHSRIEARIEYLSKKLKVGNVYANRSMVGAQVESQPFGGRGLSGTGFKAGGPHYLLRFLTEKTTSVNLTAIGGNLELLG